MVKDCFQRSRDVRVGCVPFLSSTMSVSAMHIRAAGILASAAKMNARGIVWAVVLFLVIVLAPLQPIALAARCQIGNVSYSIPQQAAPSQRIETATTVKGSCETNGEDYYSIRVDVIDAPSGLIVSSNSTPIGYNATNFTITVDNLPTTPSNNGTWHILVDVYVIRAGGTSGSYLLDYRTSTNATMQIGEITPIPEFSEPQILSVIVSMSAIVVSLQRRRKRRT